MRGKLSMSKDLDEMLKEAPTLTFNPFPEEKKEVIAEPEPQKKEEQLEVILSPEEQKMVNDFAAQIDLTNTQMVMRAICTVHY